MSCGSLLSRWTAKLVAASSQVGGQCGLVGGRMPLGGLAERAAVATRPIVESMVAVGKQRCGGLCLAWPDMRR